MDTKDSIGSIGVKGKLTYGPRPDSYNLIFAKLDIIKLMSSDCKYARDSWYFSIYGESDDIDFDKLIDIDELIITNYCAVTPRLSRYWCDKCQNNIKKIKYLLDEGRDLSYIVIHWNKFADYDSVVLNTTREIRELTQFYINPDYKIVKFDDYFDKPLDNYIEKLKECEVFNVGWYFNGSLEPLLQLSNLKGIIFGHWFQGDLNVLEPLVKSGTLEFIQVRYSYNKPLCDNVYKITFRMK